MYLLNNIEILFTSMSLSMVFFGILLNLFEPYLPIILTRSFRYGKCACTKDSIIVKKFECSKSYFRHFYIVGVTFSSFVLYLMIRIYVFNYETDKWLVTFLDYVYGCKERKSTVSKSCAFIVMILITLQSYRRFYDTHFVSVFSTKSTMNILHYIVGVIYYPAMILALICEAPGFTIISNTSTTIYHDNNKNLLDLNIVDYIAILLFLWAWWHQHVTSVILANLRKNKKGDVISDSHQVPNGDWFKYLSSPHSTAEILMYTCLTWLLINSRTWWTVYVWVLSNQVETTLLSHWWYKSTFKDFPSNRKALIPFIY